MRSTTPDIKALVHQLTEAIGQHPALAAWQEATALYELPPAAAIAELEQRYGHTISKDVALYLQLNRHPWTCCRGSFRALSVPELTALPIEGPVLPLAREEYGAGIGVNLAVPKGASGHVVWFGEQGPSLAHNPIAMPYGSWEDLFAHLVAQAQHGMFSQDSRGWFMGIHVMLV